MTSENNQRWQLIRESIKFQIKLILDAGRDLILSPVAIICTVLDLSKDNSKDEGHFQRLMLWGHSTDHWLNLFGDLPADKKPSSAESAGNNEHEESQNGTENDGDEAVPENASVIKNQVDENLDKLFSKIELLLDEQPQEGGLTAVAKQKITDYLSVLNSKGQENTSLDNTSISETELPKSQVNEKESNNKNSTLD